LSIRYSGVSAVCTETRLVFFSLFLYFGFLVGRDFKVMAGRYAMKKGWAGWQSLA
jgi:hypothetical protein